MGSASVPRTRQSSPSARIFSESPGVVTEIVDITLTRPRDQITTKADPAFARYREHLLGLVMKR